MKLFDKYNRLNIIASILVFVVGSCAFYFMLRYVLISQVDQSLETEQQEITTYVSTHKALPEIIRTRGQYTSYEPTTGKQVTSFGYVPNKYEKDETDMREIQFAVPVNGKYYLVTVDEPLEETEDLLQVIIGVTVIMIGIILLIGYLINRIVIRRLWKPFYNTIDNVKAYHLSDQPSVQPENTGIDEFSLLNQSINEMTERIQRDYSSLKNFTGQAAHEMQTPLAIIRTRLDTLIQNELLLEKNAQQIIDIERAVHRLSRLHQSLLLLTKVENRQFILDEDVNMDKVIEDKCIEYAEMTEAMQLHIYMQLRPVTIKFHQHLADILIGNLLNNAIRYNKPNGSIKIVLENNRLSISNTSDYLSLDSNRLFKRFYRGAASEEGTGLGLSIVKQICDLAGYPIEYTHNAGWHDFIIYFPH